MLTSPAQSSGEVATPFPPRFWWTRRIALFLLILLALLVLLRLIWGWDVDRRFKAEIDALHARGQRIWPEEFATEPVPEDQNAVTYIKQAIAAVNKNADPPAATDMVYPNYLPMSDEWWAVEAKAVEGNAKSLQFLRQARQHDKVDWGVQFTRDGINKALPSLNSQRHLANLMGDTSVYLHLTGNDAEAIETLRDLYALSDSLERPRNLINHLVGIGINALGSARLAVIAPGLHVADDPHPGPSTRPVTPVQRQQVQELISLLLRKSEGTLQGALEGERMFVINEIENQTRWNWLLRPFYRMTELQIIKTSDGYISAATQPSLAQATKLMPVTPSVAQNLTMGMIFQGFGRLFITDFRVRMELRLTAVSLAARLYQIDHNGAWPPDLQALVPKYLPAVPVDPFSPTGNPLQYIIINNGRRPIVYSVSDDGIDDTKKGSVPPATPVYSWEQLADQWRDVSRFDAPPTTQPAN